MDTYSLPLQTVKLICNTDNISTGAGDMRHRVAGAGWSSHTRDDSSYNNIYKIYIHHVFIFNKLKFIRDATMTTLMEPKVLDFLLR